jgi:RimJ/RimL family protein N-acetyltransferase
MTITLREAGPDDARAVAELHLRSASRGLAPFFPLDATPRPVADLAEDWLALVGPGRPSGRVVMVAEDGGELVGVTVAGPDPGDPAVGRLTRLYVSPGRWGGGVGRLLHEAGLAHLRELGCRQATFWVLEDNRRARSWYERLGCVPTGERRPSCESALCGPATVYDLHYRFDLSLEECVFPSHPNPPPGGGEGG